MFNGRRMLYYLMFGVALSLVVSSVLYFWVYPVTSSREIGQPAEGDFVISGDITLLVNVTQQYPNSSRLLSDKVKISGEVSVDTTETVDGAYWAGDHYNLQVTGAHGNMIAAFIEFFFLKHSLEQNADIYGIRIGANSNPHPLDTFWRVDSSGIDDRNGPASEVKATVRTTNLLDAEPKLPTDGIVDASYYRRYGYSIAVAKQTVLSGDNTDFSWRLGFSSASSERGSENERSSAMGTYLLVLTVAHQQTVHINELQFRGNFWRSGFPPLVENLWAAIRDIDINYYS